jgi:NADH-quinone oxidoreductase subunit H
MSADQEFLLVTFIKCIAVITIVMSAVPVSVYCERRFIALLQDRFGPNRVGPFGVLQPIADAVKLLLKENVVVDGADSLVYKLAPAFALIPAVLGAAVIPMSGYTDFFGLLQSETALQASNVNIGFLFIFAVSGIGVYGICLGGWSSNNKWSLLGGLRGSAQMISYELAFGLSVLGVVMLSGTMNLMDIADKQAGGFWNWYIFQQPLGFLLFLLAIFAETNRLPFDMPEAESELTGGYHTEYSSMRFALFFMGEYAAMFVLSGLAITLFLGGFHAPLSLGWIPPQFVFIVELGWFLAKEVTFLLFFIWVRGTYPRIRYDQLMAFGWKVLLPLSLINLLITAALMTFLETNQALQTGLLFVLGVAIILIADKIVSSRIGKGRKTA